MTFIPDRTYYRIRTLIPIAFAVIAAASSFISILIGTYLRLGFQSGIECDMTWSNPGFIVLDHGAEYPYRLLRFIDKRDGRLNGVFDSYNSIGHDFKLRSEYQDEAWCKLGKSNHGHPVLFIPGHDGDYLQARSLGSFGINLTRNSSFRGSVKKGYEVRKKLLEGTMTGNATRIEDFAYDVYTVDFNGEGGGMHGSMLFAQAAYVAGVLERLAEACDHEVIVVAHSIGGLVARMAVLTSNQKRVATAKSLASTNVITLATPHSSLPMTFEPSVALFQEHLLDLERNWNHKQYNIFSVSGGLRDEIIHPSLCECNHLSSLYCHTFMAADVLNEREEIQYSGLNFGVDHKAIVWCHGLLSVIREMIYTMAVSSSSSETLEGILHLLNEKTSRHKRLSCDFTCAYKNSEKTLEESFGSFGAFAIRTSMIYNMKSFVALYAIQVLIHFIMTLFSFDIFLCCQQTQIAVLAHLYSIITFLSFALLPNQWKPVTLNPSLVVICLGFFSMSVYFVILYVLLPILSAFWARIKMAANIDFAEEYYLEYREKECIVRECVRFSLVYLCLVVIIQVVVSRFWNIAVVTNVISIQAHIFLVVIFLLYCNLLSMCFNPSRDSERVLKLQRIAVSLLFVLLPVLALGKIMFAFSLLTINGQAKAKLYLKFQYDSCCLRSNMNTMSLSCALGDKYVHDLMKFNLYVSIPILMILLYLRYYTKVASIMFMRIKKSR